MEEVHLHALFDPRRIGERVKKFLGYEGYVGA
jgi:hypothetical protein